MHKNSIFFPKCTQNNSFYLRHFKASVRCFPMFFELILDYFKLIYFFVFYRKYLCIACISDMIYNKFGTIIFMKGKWH